jgi:hypothetical protein
MKLDKNILNELQEVAPTLAKLDKVDIYQVGESYFQNSAVAILNLITAPEHSTLLSSIPQRELYAAPASSYFASFSDDLIGRINAEEVAEELSYTIPALQHSDKKELYQVPASYFASFPDTVIKLAAKEPMENPAEHWATGIWSIFAERLSSLLSRPRYSFAMASFAGLLICVIVAVNTQNTLSSDDKIFAEMQQIPDADLHLYIDKHRDEFDERTILTNINNVDFTHYFDKPDQVTPHIESHAKGSKNDEINEDILD